MARELKRINMNVPFDLLDRIDAYAEKMGITRSSAMNVLCASALDSQKAVDGISELMEFLQKNEVKTE